MTEKECGPNHAGRRISAHRNCGVAHMARPAHDYARVDKHVPVTRRAETANPYSPVMILISVIATLGILLYAQFLLNPDNRGDFLPYAMVIAAESVLVAHALLSM